MSGRGATPAALAEIAKEQVQTFYLYELYLDSSTIYATDTYTPISWGGNTYLANGAFLGFDQIEETGDLSGNTTSVSLSGVDQTFIASILLENYIDRRLVIRKAFWSAGTVVLDPIPVLDGRIDQPVIAEDPTAGTCTVTVTVGSHWVDFERKSGRHTNDAEQKLFFAGDTGFRLIGASRADVKWGTT
ncbi:MAG: hypothetical protein ACKO0Z_08290 [Betaproteobacteria bacterium]